MADACPLLSSQFETDNAALQAELDALQRVVPNGDMGISLESLATETSSELDAKVACPPSLESGLTSDGRSRFLVRVGADPSTRHEVLPLKNIVYMHW